MERRQEVIKGMVEEGLLGETAVTVWERGASTAKEEKNSGGLFTFVLLLVSVVRAPNIEDRRELRG